MLTDLDAFARKRPWAAAAVGLAAGAAAARFLRAQPPVKAAWPDETPPGGVPSPPMPHSGGIEDFPTTVTPVVGDLRAANHHDEAHAAASGAQPLGGISSTPLPADMTGADR